MKGSVRLPLSSLTSFERALVTLAGGEREVGFVTQKTLRALGSHSSSRKSFDAPCVLHRHSRPPLSENYQEHVPVEMCHVSSSSSALLRVGVLDSRDLYCTYASARIHVRELKVTGRHGFFQFCARCACKWQRNLPARSGRKEPRNAVTHTSRRQLKTSDRGTADSAVRQSAMHAAASLLRPTPLSRVDLNSPTCVLPPPLAAAVTRAVKTSSGTVEHECTQRQDAAVPWSTRTKPPLAICAMLYHAAGSMHRPSRSSLDTAASWSRPSLLISPSAPGTESGISSPPTSEEGDHDADERKLLGSTPAAMSTGSYARDEFGPISPFASPSVSPPRRLSFRYDDAPRRISNDLAVAAEEGALVGSRASSSDIPRIRMEMDYSDRASGSSTGSGVRRQASTETDRINNGWYELYSRAQDIVGQWRHIYDNEGVSG